MDNVHGFHSNNRLNNETNQNNVGNNQNRNPQQNRDEQPSNFLPAAITEDQIAEAERHRIMFVSGRQNLKNPRDEIYCDMLRTTFCPVLSCLSLTFLLVLVDTVMFIISLVKGINLGGDFLEVQAATLVDLGGNISPNIYNGQVYRLIGAIFLHSSFLHYIGNILSTLIFVSRIEYTYGWPKTLLVYLASGIAANIFSALVNPVPDTVKIGASTSLFGMIGIFFGYIIINWSGMDLLGTAMKCQLCCTALMIIIFIIVFTTASSTDYLGHFGGFLAGVWLSSIHQTIINTTREKIFRIVFASLFIIQVLICFLVFYLQPNPSYALPSV